MSKAQYERILKLNIKDKKLTRLMFCPQLSPGDSLFLNYAYEEKHNMQMRFSPISTQLGFMAAIGGVQHLFWTSTITKRWAKLSEPYYQKYSIK